MARSKDCDYASAQCDWLWSADGMFYDRHYRTLASLDPPNQYSYHEKQP
jgi:hypothetical protein